MLRFRHVVTIALAGDSSACYGTLHREGSGRIKHLELRQLWLQAKVKTSELQYKKVPREQNPADSLAKPWAQDGLRHFAMIGLSAQHNMR